MGSARYAQLALAWLEWLSGLPLREPPATAADTSLRAYAQKRVHKYYKRLISAPKLTALFSTESARHKERIQAKYFALYAGVFRVDCLTENAQREQQDGGANAGCTRRRQRRGSRVALPPAD